MNNRLIGRSYSCLGFRVREADVKAPQRECAGQARSTESGATGLGQAERGRTFQSRLGRLCFRGSVILGAVWIYAKSKERP